ncbi:MAG: class I SAM-dependent RNA methyltransferase [Nitrospiraceae bacterium]|nr:class I SAM-dependent RNA methyltransferase [Nitrospiraceae bacterium]
MSMVLMSLSPAYGGYSIARDEKVILIRGAIPGEVVEAEITEKKKDYATARVVKVLEPSDDRVEPPCPVFGICGGCHLQFVSYARQVSMKDEILLDSLTRIGGIQTAPGPALCGDQWHYRRRAQFKVGKTGEIGFFREASRDVVTFESCPLMDAGINEVLAGIRKNINTTGLSEIHISSGDRPLALLRGKEYRGSPFEDYLAAGCAGVAFEGAVVAGADATRFDLNGLAYAVSPWTFFQAHWDLNRRVAELIVEELSPLGGKRVLDLYAGAGNFALPLAGQATEVVAVEENPHAVDDGLRNIRENGLKHCRIVRSSAEKYKIGRKYDVLIVDPPRPGLTTEVVKKILEMPPETIVYISCNPATLSRDLKKLKEKYDIMSVRQIDFFPNTFHIESISFLRLR